MDKLRTLGEALRNRDFQHELAKSENVDQCLKAAVDKWVNCPESNWNILATALSKIELHDLAEEAKKYQRCKSMKPCASFPLVCEQTICRCNSLCKPLRYIHTSNSFHRPCTHRPHSTFNVLLSDIHVLMPCTLTVENFVRQHTHTCRIILGCYPLPHALCLEYTCSVLLILLMNYVNTFLDHLVFYLCH